jgi:FtsH-binding integral membrane protein
MTIITERTEDIISPYGHTILWRAVFAGVAVALASQLILSLLGLGIGLNTVNPATEYNSTDGLGTGATIWWLLSMLISLFLGGWTAGRLSGTLRPSDGMIHGILAFCLMSLAMIYLLTTAVGGLISGATGIVGKGLSLAGQGAIAVAPKVGQIIEQKIKEQEIDFTSLRKEAELLLKQTGKSALQPKALEKEGQKAESDLINTSEQIIRNPQSADTSAMSLINSIFMQGDKLAQNVDRDAAINVLVARTGVSRQEAAKTADRWIQTYDEARATLERNKEELQQTTNRTIQSTASVLSKTALLAFFGLLCSGIVAAIGGWIGTPQSIVRTKTDIINTDRGNLRTSTTI